jgi:catalase
MTVATAVALTPSMFAPVSTPAFAIREVSFLVLAIAAFIFIVVAGLTVYAIIRFRHRPGSNGREPPQLYGSTQIELAWTDKMRALRPDPATGKPNPEALAAFGASHPDNRGQAKFLADHNPPASYATSAYFGIHTFKFIDRANKVTLVRWRFVPGDGEKALTDSELKSAPRDFLERALIDRTRQGPVRWAMLLTIGEPGDPENDPTLAWPQSRKELKVGTLTISSAMTQKGAACENINYDPLVMADGIAPTDDPVLLFRSPSYVRSYTKRLQGL